MKINSIAIKPVPTFIPSFANLIRMKIFKSFSDNLHRATVHILISSKCQQTNRIVCRAPNQWHFSVDNDNKNTVRGERDSNLRAFHSSDNNNDLIKITNFSLALEHSSCRRCMPTTRKHTKHRWVMAKATTSSIFHLFAEQLGTRFMPTFFSSRIDESNDGGKVLSRAA